MKRILTIGAALLVAGFFVACGHFNRTLSGRAEFITSRMASKLDLNADQTSKLNAMRDEIVHKIQSSTEERNKIHAEFTALVRSDRIDPAKLSELREKRTRLHNEVEELISRKIVEFHAILTPEQRAKAAEFLEKFHEKMREHLSAVDAAES